MDNKNMSAFVFMAMLFPAAIFDLLSLIPFIGNLFSVLFIFFARLSFWLAGYRSKGTTALTAGTALVEMIPGFSILPGCIAFVTGFYLINKASAVISGTKIGRFASAKIDAQNKRARNIADAERRRQKRAEQKGDAVLVA